MKTVTSKQMRKIEQIAIDELGIPSILLMEHAALQLAKHCFKALKEIKNPKVLIISGAGNNGGDGMALARHLHLKGIETNVIHIRDINVNPGQINDAAAYFTMIKKLEIPIVQLHHADRLTDIQSIIEVYDLVVDAMLGTGLSRNVEGSYKFLIEMINRYAKYIISVDIPSGVHSDTGRIMGCAVRAAETVTFCSPKTGLFLYPGAEYAGKVHIEDISIPGTLIDRINIETEILTDSEARALLPIRKQRSNKGTFGRIMVFAGSNEMPGAAALTCSAVYKTGGGLVNACVVSDTAKVIHHWQREVITRIVPDKNGMYCKKSLSALTEEISRANVIVIGPGIGRSSDVKEFVYELLNIAKVPLVLDADALFAVSENVNILKTLKVPCVITPHPGEMSKLTGLNISEVLDNTIGVAAKFSGEFNVVTLLKDAHTIIANPNGAININTTGNNALAKAGTGDVLTGMIAGFIAQSGLDIFTASILGAYFHGKAGEAAVMGKSHYGITASDVLNCIPAVMT
jgi:NAD(P)H-hydrate epimerase